MLVWQKKTAILQAVRKKEDNGRNHPLLLSLQRIPQYVEVPPNVEAKRIISYFLLFSPINLIPRYYRMIPNF